MLLQNILLLSFACVARALHIEHFKGSGCTGEAGSEAPITLNPGDIVSTGPAQNLYYPSFRVHATMPDRILVTAYSYDTANCNGAGLSGGTLIEAEVKDLPNNGCVDPHIPGCAINQLALGKW